MINMNFPFFMLMVGPSQTGKTTWIFNFLKCFSHINEGHTLKNILFLHMAEFITPPNFDDDYLKKVTFHSVKANLSKDESKMDNEIIESIENFKRKIESEDGGDEFQHNLVIMDDMMLAVGSRKKIMQYVEELVT